MSPATEPGGGLPLITNSETVVSSSSSAGGFGLGLGAGLAAGALAAGALWASAIGEAPRSNSARTAAGPRDVGNDLSSAPSAPAHAVHRATFGASVLRLRNRTRLGPQPVEVVSHVWSSSLKAPRAGGNANDQETAARGPVARRRRRRRRRRDGGRPARTGAQPLRAPGRPADLHPRRAERGHRRLCGSPAPGRRVGHGAGSQGALPAEHGHRG